MNENEKKHKLSTKTLFYFFSTVCVLLIGVTFFTDKLTNPIRNLLSYVVVPMQKGVNNMGLWAYDKNEELKDAKELARENAELKKQVADLTERNKQLEQNSYELSRLRELYKLDEKYASYEKVGARVIAMDNSNWFSRFTISKGTKDGMKPGMNVIADGGLVGIIISCDDHSSVVRSIIDDLSYVSAMLIDTGEICTVKGNLKLINSGKLEVSNFKANAQVAVGKAIVTSNISDKYLEGILIGYISEFKTDENNLTQSGYLVPVVDFEHLQEVLVITQLK